MQPVLIVLKLIVKTLTTALIKYVNVYRLMQDIDHLIDRYKFITTRLSNQYVFIRLLRRRSAVYDSRRPINAAAATDTQKTPGEEGCTFCSIDGLNVESIVLWAGLFILIGMRNRLSGGLMTGSLRGLTCPVAFRIATM